MKINDLTKSKGTRSKAFRLLRRGGVSLAELADKLDCSPRRAQALVDELRAAGKNVRLADARIEIPAEPEMGGRIGIRPNLYEGRVYKFGIVSDTHLCSRYCRLDVLNAVYDIYAKAGIRDVYHAGNIIDGKCRFNQYDLVPGTESMEGQIDFLRREYPQRKGVITHFVAGDDHEGWWAQREGVNIGRLIESRCRDAGREDLKYIGYLESDVMLKQPGGRPPTWMRVMHSGGGSAYALSYVSQKLVESFQGGEKPAVLVVGHHHKMDFCMPREVFCFQAGCTQDQTPFMRKKKIEAHVGAWECWLVQAPDGHVSACGGWFHRFYDRGFYAGKERFPRW